MVRERGQQVEAIRNTGRCPSRVSLAGMALSSPGGNRSSKKKKGGVWDKIIASGRFSKTWFCHIHSCLYLQSLCSSPPCTLISYLSLSLLCSLCILCTFFRYIPSKLQRLFFGGGGSCRKLSFLIQRLKRVRFFLSSSDTSVQNKSFPFPAVALLILHIVQIYFLNLSPENIPVCLIWSKSEPLNTQPVCEVGVTLLLVCPTDLRQGYLELGRVWEPTREACCGETQAEVKCHNCALTCSRHLGKIISGDQKEKNNGF